jgi:hypothetical protein
MSPFIFVSARGARRFAPLALALGVSVSLGFTGCSSDSSAVPDGTTTQTLPPDTEKGDPLPGGAISFFNSPACPEGWAPFAEGAGRIAVPTVSADDPLVMKGTPLKDGEDRTHNHLFDAEATLTPVSYVGATGGGNANVAEAKAVTITGPVDKVSSGLPYVQLLACKKLGAPRPGSLPIPRGLLIFFNGTSCPAGWSQPIATQGRMMVGVPEGAKPGLSFGGTSLTSGEARAHGHDVNGSLKTTSHGIALASGCCGDGYAKDGEYLYSGGTDDVGVELPTVQVLQCQKM